MAFQPHDIETKTFRRSWRGFDPDEVRDYLEDVAAALRDDDDFHRAGIEVATALRRMHEIVTEVREQVEHEASTLRRQAILDAEALITEARHAADQMLLESQEAAGKERFEAAVWAMQVRAEAEVDRQAAEARVAEAEREVDRLAAELERRAEEAVTAALDVRRLDAERVERRIGDLESEELSVVGRLRKIHREIAALVEAPIDVEPVPLPARHDADETDGVVLDLTGTDRLDAAVRAGLRRGLTRRDG